LRIHDFLDCTKYAWNRLGKAKPVARLGRKAADLEEIAGLPKGDPVFFILGLQEAFNLLPEEKEEVWR
jgi:hypothetical protein